MNTLLVLAIVVAFGFVVLRLVPHFSGGSLNKCAACNDPVRPAGSYMFRTGSTEGLGIMSLKPGYPCRRCRRVYCQECIRKGPIWRCPRGSHEIEPVSARFY